MKICIISPSSHVWEFSTLGDAEMALTHIVLDIEQTYGTWINQYIDYYHSAASRGKFVILDNSAYEIGKLEKATASGQGLGADLVLKAADIIKPSIVICQDILCDKDATFESTKEFIKYVKNQGKFGNFQLMGVAQGNTEDSWLSSFQQLYEMPEIDMIGLSKISVPISFGGDQQSSGCITQSRLKCTARLEELGWTAKKVHLLGGDNHLGYELSQQKKHHFVYSNDSSAAVQYGLHGQQFDDQGKIRDIITKKPDLENKDENTVEQLDNRADMIFYNIARLHQMSKN